MAEKFMAGGGERKDEGKPLSAKDAAYALLALISVFSSSAFGGVYIWQGGWHWPKALADWLLLGGAALPLALVIPLCVHVWRSSDYSLYAKRG